MSDFYVILTEKGKSELLNAISSNTAFKPSYMAVGDGGGEYYEPDKAQTELKNQVYRGDIYAKGKKITAEGNYLYFQMQLPPSAGDFTIREVGLFNSNNELLAVSKYPETKKLKADSWYDRTVNIELQIALSDEAITTIIIDDSGVVVTEKQLADKVQETKEDVINILNETINNIDIGANEQLSNLDYSGRAKLQYAPFAINAGAIENGQNNTLQLGANEIIDVQYIQPTNPSGITSSGWTNPENAFDDISSTYATASSTSAYIERDFGQVLTLSAVSATGNWVNTYCASCDLNIYGVNNNNEEEFIAQTWGRTNTAVYSTQASFSPATYSKIRIYPANVGGYYGVRIVQINITATYQKNVSGELLCAPCTITTTDSRTKVFENTSSLDVQNQSDGNYSIFKDYQTGALSLLLNTDYSLDTSAIPANLYVNDVLNNDLVYLGDCTISSGVISSITNREFNNSGYLINRNYIEISKANALNPVSFVNKSMSGFTVEEEGYIECMVRRQSQSNAIVYINSVPYIQAYTSGTGAVDGYGVFRVHVGDYVLTDSSYPTTGYGWIHFYPLKGVN